jgi:spermidine synthase
MVPPLSADQLNIYDNGKLLFSTDNQIANEEAVHFAMAQHPGPRNVLLVSGGISGITGEILKYSVDRVDYVEINPLIFTLGQKYTSSLEDPRIYPIRQDARMFLKKTGPLYDVVLINLPEPSTAQLNRFYTVEFLYQVKDRMNNGGIIALNMPSTVNYLSDEALMLNSVIYNTCQEVFAKVLIIPGQRNYYLASDKPLTINVAQLIENKNIKNDYLNLNYIDTLSLQERSDYLIEHLDLNAFTNKDFKPVSYFYYLGYWLSQFNLGKNLLWAMLTLFILALSSPS